MRAVALRIVGLCIRVRLRGRACVGIGLRLQQLSGGAEERGQECSPGWEPVESAAGDSLAVQSLNPAE